MKAKYTILIITIGYCLDFIGTLLKIQHHGYADRALLIATILKATGLVLLAYKIIQYGGLKDFMNK